MKVPYRRNIVERYNLRMTIAEAEQRLAQVAMRLGMTPQSAGVSAFLNALLLSAKVDALTEYVQPFELDATGSPIMKGTFEEIYARHLAEKANTLETAVNKPRLVTANGAALNG